MSEENTYNSKVIELLSLTKGRGAVPAIFYDKASNQVFFTDIDGNTIGLDDYVTFVRGVDEDGKFTPSRQTPRPMTVREYMDYQEQSFGASQIYVRGYVERTRALIEEKGEELKLAQAEVDKYQGWKDASKNRIDLHYNKQKLKDATEKRNEILESSIPIPSAEQLQEMMKVAERADNVIDSIRLRKTDLRNWDNLSQEVKDYYVSLNDSFATKEGREEGMKTANAQIRNFMGATQDKLEELEGKAPLVVVSEEELKDRTIGFALEFGGKALTTAAALIVGTRAGNKLGSGTSKALTDKLAISPLVKLPLGTRIGVGGTGFLVDAAGGIIVEDLAAKAYDELSLKPKMNMIIESGALTEETAKLAQERMTAESQGSFGPIVYGIDGIGLNLPILGPIKAGDMSKVHALYFGDIEMSGQYIPSKGINFGQIEGTVERNEDSIARTSQLGVMHQTLDARFEEYRTERENQRQEGKSPLDIPKVDDVLTVNNDKGDGNVR